MSKFELLELLQQDIEDIKGLLDHNNCDISMEIIKKQARGILLNLQEHLEEFIQL